MRRTLTVLGMAAALGAGQAALAGPAGADVNCSLDTVPAVCHGGQGFGGGDGGFGGLSIFNPETGASFSSGGGTLTQGGYGLHCTVSAYDATPVCVGGSS